MLVAEYGACSQGAQRGRGRVTLGQILGTTNFKGCIKAELEGNLRSWGGREGRNMKEEQGKREEAHFRAGGSS
jgi:hypothetical protein